MSLTRRGLTALLLVVVLIGAVPLSGNRVEAYTATSQEAHARLFNTIALFTGSHRAIVNNAFAAIDEVSPLTKPIVVNSRTLVPLRFVSEKLGAIVVWNGADKSVSITLGEMNISMRVSNRVITINSKQVTLDVAPMVTNGRTFVPLRAISEAFGQQVFYDRGLIVISDGVVLSASTDKALVTEIIGWFRGGTMPAWEQAAKSLQQLAALDESVVVVFALDANGQRISQGSGFVLGDNLIATCLHVIQDAASFEIKDNAGQIHRVAGAASYSVDYDLAVLKTETPLELPALPTGRLADVGKGDSIVAIGSPLGLENTITQGIVSNIHNVEGVSLVQISAALAPGSSGGPVLNMRGEVIGIAASGYEGTDFNFAVPVDYLLPLFQQFTGMNSADIPVVTVPMSEPSEEEVPVIAPDPTLVAPIKEVGLNFQPTDVVLHPTQPIIYATDKGNQAVYAINYETKAISRLDFPYMPERIVFANGEIFVALLHRNHNSSWPENLQTGSIAIINPATFTVVDTLDIRQDPFDLAVDKQGYIYVASGSGSFNHVMSYSRQIKAKLSEQAIYDLCYIELSPTVDRIYAVSLDVSPRDMQYLTFRDGKVIDRQDSPYHGDHVMDTNFKLSPDGSFVFNSSGLVLYPTLSYAGDLGHWFEDIDFNLGQNEIYTSVEGGQIYVNSYDTWEHTETMQIVGEAERIFYRNNSLIVQRYNNGKYYISVYSLE